jgi:hypothetical protein
MYAHESPQATVSPSAVDLPATQPVEITSIISAGEATP